MSDKPIAFNFKKKSDQPKSLLGKSLISKLTKKSVTKKRPFSKSSVKAAKKETVAEVAEKDKKEQ
jgi:hypothetical protein